MLGRFEKAVDEIRAMKREINRAHSQYDDLELHSLQLQQNLDITAQHTDSQTQLMTHRIQDLTNKLNNSEKQVNFYFMQPQNRHTTDNCRGDTMKIQYDQYD